MPNSPVLVYDWESRLATLPPLYTPSSAIESPMPEVPLTQTPAPVAPTSSTSPSITAMGAAAAATPSIPSAQQCFAGILDLQRLAKLRIDVIGVGAIGAQVAPVLAQLGAQKFTLWDRDLISPTNVGTQGWPHMAIGRGKAVTLQDGVNNAYRGTACVGLTRWALPEDFRPGAALHQSEIIFMCVDSLRTRRELFQAALRNSEANRPTFKLWLDARMSAEEFELYTVIPTRESCALYVRSLDEDEGPPLSVESCTTRATPYCARIAANFLVSSFVRWLRGDVLPRPFKMHIPTMSMDYMDYLYKPAAPAPKREAVLAGV